MQFYEREIRCVYLVVVIGAGMKVVGGCCLVDLFSVKFSRHGWSIVMLLTLRFRTKHYTAANLMFFGSPEDHNTLLSHVAYVWLSSLQILLELCGWVLYIRLRWKCVLLLDCLVNMCSSFFVNEHEYVIQPPF